MKACERRCVVDQPIAHHLQRHELAGRLVLRAIDDRHAAAADTAEDPESLHLLAAEPVVRALPQTIGDELGQHDAEFEMAHRQPIEGGGGHEQHPHRRIGQDIRASRFPGHEGHLPDEVAAGESPDAVIAVGAAQTRMRGAL